MSGVVWCRYMLCTLCVWWKGDFVCVAAFMNDVTCDPHTSRERKVNQGIEFLIQDYFIFEKFWEDEYFGFNAREIVNDSALGLVCTLT